MRPVKCLRYIRAAWNLTTDAQASTSRLCIALNDLGAVITNASRMRPRKTGFDAEWRVITVVTVEGDMLNRCEVFDEEDLDAALARFDELHPPTPRLENTRKRVCGSAFFRTFAARDWDAVAQITGRRTFPSTIVGGW